MAQQSLEINDCPLMRVSLSNSILVTLHIIGWRLTVKIYNVIFSYNYFLLEAE